LSETTNLGFFLLARTALHLGTSASSDFLDFEADHGIAGFIKEAPKENPSTPFRLIPPPGTCTVYTGHMNPGILEAGPFGAIVADSVSWLDAGARIVVKGPKRQENLIRRPNQLGLFQTVLGGRTPRAVNPRPLFLEPGHYSLTIPGATDVGPFKVTLDAARPVRWTNSTATRTIDRSQGFLVKWRSQPFGQILIALMGVDQLTSAAGFTVCLSPARNGRFFVPPETLANIPESKPIPGLPMDYAFVIGWDGREIARTVPGLNQIFAASVSVSGTTVEFR
jgi:hypothetical protein